MLIRYRQDIKYELSSHLLAKTIPDLAENRALKQNVICSILLVAGRAVLGEEKTYTFVDIPPNRTQKGKNKS
jgi:hypothetical protein